MHRQAALLPRDALLLGSQFALRALDACRGLARLTLQLLRALLLRGVPLAQFGDLVLVGRAYPGDAVRPQFATAQRACRAVRVLVVEHGELASQLLASPLHLLVVAPERLRFERELPVRLLGLRRIAPAALHRGLPLCQRVLTVLDRRQRFRPRRELGVDMLPLRLNVALQPGAGLPYRVLQRREFGLQRVRLLRRVRERPRVLTRCLQHGDPLLDPGCTLDGALPAHEALVEGRGFRLLAGLPLARALCRSVLLVPLRLPAFQVRDLVAEELQPLRESVHRSGSLGEFALGLGQSGARLIGFRGPLAQAVDVERVGVELRPCVASTQPGALREFVVPPEAEHPGEHVLPHAGRGHRELVGASLHEERAVHERPVVHVDDALDLRLRRPDGVARDGAELSARGLDRQLQRTLRVAPRLGVATGDAVALAADVEHQLDVHLGLAVVEQLLVPLAARLAPERPRDGVQQRRLAVAVRPAKARDADALQVERGGGAAIGEEVGE